MTNNFEEIGHRIRTARKMHNYSQSDLSEILQISPSYMSDIENGKTNIGLDIFMRITEALQVSADWLLQTDTPSVNAIVNSDMNKLLSDCPASELRLYLDIIHQVKKYITSVKEEK